MAEAFQRPVAPHDCTGPVVFAASIHLALNLPNAIFQESVRAYYTSWYKDLVTVMPRIEDGFIYPFEGPGLGLELSDALLANPEASSSAPTHPVYDHCGWQAGRGLLALSQIRHSGQTL